MHLSCRNSRRCAAPRRHRIKSSPLQRMAPEQPAHRHRSAPQPSILAYGDRRILRARRLISACACGSSQRMERRRQCCFIYAQKPRRDPLPHASALHRFASTPDRTPAKMRATSPARRPNSISSTVRRGWRTTSTHPGRSFTCSRTASRMRLRIRFRSTAFPSTRPVVRPTRACASAASPSPRIR